MRIRAFAIGLALAWATIGGARAADVLFTITNTASGKTLATFELPQNPGSLVDNTVNGVALPGFFFEIFSVPVVIDGVPSPTPLTNLTFYANGGFSDEPPLFDFHKSKQVFYTGSESSPTFRSGFFVTLDDNVFGGTIDTVTVSLVGPRDPPTLSAPELSSWGMLLLGFLGLSYVGYRKAKASATLPA
jgi:hypothetical protein